MGPRCRRATRHQRHPDEPTAMTHHEAFRSSPGEGTMDERPHGTNRRDFLKAVGLGALGTVAVGGAATTLGWGLADADAATVSMALAGTDGYITVPGRSAPVYIMGFVPVSPTASVSSLIATYKGHAQHVAPIFGFRQGDDIRITLTNLGLIQRPDLTDT